eukprot:TRINITY_DN4234_c0_g1_i1.p1 TRINITY_DN4234_c0_g1~~TRINITY_DN4234_c0_g1_i1.p1  ORF type:complete len:242 (-),score=48.41 TRINITY_DN4234_c0_g1_i1:71-730(-)
MKNFLIVLTFVLFCKFLFVNSETYPVQGKLKLVLNVNNTYVQLPLSASEQKGLLTRTRLKLSGNRNFYETLPRIDGTFSFPDVEPGAYFLEIFSPDLSYQPLRVDVSKKNQGKVKARYAISDPTGSTVPRSLPYPLIIYPDAKMDYWQERIPFDLVQMVIKQPMMLMVGFTILMIVIMQFIDPKEALKELQQESGQNSQAEKSPEELLPSFIPQAVKRR